MHGEEKKSDERQLLADLLRPAAVGGVDDQPADFGGAVVVVPDREDLVAKVTIERGGVVLALGHFVEDVGGVVGAVLGDDQTGPGDFAGGRVLEHEEVLLLPPIFDAAAEASPRSLEKGRQSSFMIGQIDGVERAGQSLEVWQIALPGVAEQEHDWGSVARRKGVRSGRGRIRLP